MLVTGFGAVYYFDEIKAAVTDAAVAVHQSQDVREEVPRQTVTSSGFDRTVHLRADRSGHFAVAAEINGRDVALLADTGATLVALTYDDAREIGFTHNDLSFTARSRTANGTASMAMVMLDRIRVGDIEVRDVRAMVAEPGKLHISLLGMSFLSRLESFQIRGNELVLNQ